MAELTPEQEEKLPQATRNTVRAMRIYGRAPGVVARRVGRANNKVLKRK